jgi:hypothetical protein
LWGQDFILPPPFEAAFFGLSRDAGKNAGGRMKS